MLSDWTILKSNPSNIECGITTITPFLGSGSLRIKDNAATNLNMYSNLYTPGLTRGRMRMLIRITAQGGTSNYRTGFYFQSNDSSLVSGATQTFYSAHLRLTSSLTARRFAVSHFTGGIGGTETVLFLSSLISTMTNGVSVLPLEVTWEQESELAGVKIILKGSIIGNSTLTDFSNMIPLSTMIVANPPYVINGSVSEGVYYYGGSSAGGSEIEYDSVSIYSQTPI